MMVCMSDLDTSISQDCQGGQRAARVATGWEASATTSSTCFGRVGHVGQTHNRYELNKTVCEGGIERLSGDVRS
jgi:hypothetical protein